MYKISVIIPVYNAEKFLDRSINSLINQTLGFENIEVILIDDGSSDSSKDIIINYSECYPNIKGFFSEKSHGYPGFGRNVGIKNANAKYIMFMDNDDEYSLDYCEVMYNYIESYGVDSVCANHHIIKNSGIVEGNLFQAVADDLKTEDNPIIFKLDKFVYISGPEVWTKIFKTSIIQDNSIKFIEQGLNEDRLFVFNYCYYAKSLMYVDYYGYKWYRDGENLSLYSVKNTLLFIESYYELCSFLEEKYDGVDLVDFFKSSIEATIIRTMFSSDDKSDQLFLLNKLYDFERYINFNGNLNRKLLNYLNKLILKRKFSRVIFLMKILKKGKTFFDFIK